MTKRTGDMMLEEMGLPYVPFTFPTVTVQQIAERGGVKMSNAEVERIWNAYLVAEVEGGHPPFSHDMGGAKLAPLLQALEAATSLPRLKIVAWLNALEEATKAGWYTYYIDPAGSVAGDKTGIGQVTGAIGTAVGNFLKPSAEPITNLVKWTAILAASGAAVYGLWHLAPFLGLRKKKRKG